FSMAWVKCVSCGFSQIPAEKCLRCGHALPAPKAKSARPSAGAPAVDKGAWKPAQLAFGAVMAFGLAAFLLSCVLSSRPRPAPPAAVSTAAPTPVVLDLTGRWTAEAEKTLPGPPARPAIKSVYLETAREGSIQAAGVLLTDPGRGGAGAGYRMAADGRRRLDEALELLTGVKSASVPVDFIPFPAWVPVRQRLWRPLEIPGAGAKKKEPVPVRYLLLESLEDDYVVQAGINETGFLSYAFFSPTYGKARGVDLLSRIIHLEPGSSLR